MAEIFRKLLVLMYGERLKLVGLTTLYLVSTLAELSGVLAISLLVDAYLNDNFLIQIDSEILTSKQFATYLVLFVFLLRFFVLVYSQKTTIKFCLDYSAKIKVRLLESYLKRDYEIFIKQHAGQRIQVLTEVSNSFTNTFLHTALKCFTDLLLLLVLLGYLAFSHSKFVLACIVAIVILFWAYKLLLEKKIKMLGKLANESAAVSIDVMSEAILGFKEIRVMRFENKFLKTLQSAALNYASYQTNAKNIIAYLKIGIETLVFFGITFGLISVWGAEDVSRQNLTEIIPTIYVCLRLMPLVNQLVYSLNVIGFSHNSIQLIYDELSLNEGQALEYRIYNESDDRIVFSDVTLCYGENKPLLSEFSYEFRPGKLYAICGPSGSGKTTLLNAIGGLKQQTSGQIDYYTSGNEQEPSLAYLGQTPFFIRGSISDNISLGNLEAEFGLDDTMKLAVMQELSSKRDEMSSNDELSGGQKQRVGLARTIYHSRKFLLMDEPTSALDEDTSYQIFQNLTLLKSKTCIIIVSHDSDLCEKFADDVIYLGKSGETD